MNIRDRITELRRVPAADLLPNPKNWRKHPEAQQNAMRGVLAEIGFADAVLARETDDGLMLIDGHLRAEVAPDSVVPVLVLDVNEAEADVILATHDPLAAMAEADAGLLDSLLADVETTSEALAEMLTDLGEEFGTVDTPEVIEDEVPEPPADPITKPGDLWLLGDHRLLCGDATSEADVARLLDGREPFIMVTDPPYGVDYDPNWRNETNRWSGSEVKVGAKAIGVVENDTQCDWAEALALFPGVVAYVWFASLMAEQTASAMAVAGFQLRSQIVWAKSRLVIGRGHYHWQHEPCWYGAKGSAKWCGDRSQSTIWEIDKNQTNETGHSTQKPIECMARPIRNHGDAGDDVYDPFLGSGTTLIAAEQLDRKCYGLEISPAYCDVIVERWQNLTGKKATREQA